MQVIIFNQNGGVGVIIPAPNSGLTPEQTAKDVPQGASWRIVDTDDLPSHDARDRWRWTEGGALDVAPYVPPPPSPPSLTPSQWGFFLDLTGFRDALDAALAAMPKETMQERAAWAGVRNIAYGSEQYRLDVTLALVAKVRASGLFVEIPSDDDIAAAFTAAAEFKGAASLLGD